MKYIIFLILLISCSSLKKPNDTIDHLILIWQLLEKAPSEQWYKDKLVSNIGYPKEKIPHPKKKNLTGWIYLNTENSFQEWGITIDKNNIVDSVTYIPSGKYRPEFTIEKIMDRWKDLKCKKEEKQVLTPHVIKKERFISCDNGKRIIHYNRYNEVESILVKGQ